MNDFDTQVQVDELFNPYEEMEHNQYMDEDAAMDPMDFNDWFDYTDEMEL